MPSGTPTSFGRYAVAESPSSLARLHFHRGGALEPRDWEPPLAVLDQEDLLAQGIRCSRFVPGASDVDALGSCTANATVAATASAGAEHLRALFEAVGMVPSSEDAVLMGDAVAAEEAAIRFYHLCTDQTATPAQEWPPTDCGSSGPYVVSELERLGLATGDRLAHGADNIVSLMQQGGIIAGLPFLQAWMDPDPDGFFVDGDGSLLTLEAQVEQGVAGGHEVFLSAVEHVEVTETGAVVPEGTVVRFRNSWGPSWGDHGSARFHLSTLAMLGAHADFRLIVR